MRCRHCCAVWCVRNDKQATSHGALITSMKDDYDRLRADVEDLQLKHKDLLARTSTCCQSKAQLDSEIRAGISNYLMMACIHIGCISKPYSVQNYGNL